MNPLHGTLVRVVSSFALPVLPLTAQVVADGGTVTLANVTTNITGTVTVGTNGAFTLLVLSDNAVLTNSAHGVISANALARSNEVRLASPTAQWHMGGTLFVGSNGAFSTLVVSNGALVRANAGIIGRQTSSGSNVVLVTGSGSMWSNVAGVTGVGLTVGSLGSGNQLIVSNGGWVVDANASGSIGSNSSNNLARVTGPGSVWSNRFGLNINPIGAGNANNRLVIEDGGQVFNEDGLINGLNGSSNNFAFITGSGAVWNNSRDLYLGGSVRASLTVSNGGAVLCANSYVGSGGSQMLVTGGGSRWSHQNDLALLGQNNTLVVTNGGGVVNSNGYIGGLTPANLSASNNTVVVTGAGSTWSNRADLFVGFAGPRNQLVVSNGAIVTASNVFLGFQSSSLDNRIIVDGGTLRASRLEIRHGFSNSLNAGVIEADRLVVNSDSRLIFNGGTLTAGKITIVNGLSFEVGDGVSSAALHLTGNDTHDFPSTLVVRPNATLRGNGFIQAPINVQSGGTLSPGSAPGEIGRLDSITGSSSLTGTVNLEISKNGATLANDRVGIASTLTFVNATVLVTSLGPTALAAGDRFQLFTAFSFAGSIQTLSLPPLGAGLRWLTNLVVDGSIEVESLAPSVQTLPASALSQTTATLNGVANPKGTSTIAWFEFGFTTNYGNLTLPQAIGSGTNDTNFSEALTGLIPGVSYHFRAVASNSFGIAFGDDQSFPRIGQRDYIKASNTGANDAFGERLAMDGDTLVIGATGEDSNAAGVNGNQNNNNLGSAGAAYVFVRNGDTWVQQAYLKPSNPGFSDDFGNAVAVSGDTIVIGTPFEDSAATGVNGNQSDESGTNSGAAYVFVRTGTNWAQQAYLKASNTDVSDVFGASVAISGDTIVVTAPGEDSNANGVNGNQSDNSAPNSGAAYVFVRNGTTWTQQAYLKTTNAHNGEAFFGLPVRVSGDTVVLGIAGQEAADVLVRNGTTWSQQARLKSGNPGPSDRFGISVALSGDTVVVGATEEDSNATGVNGDGSNNSAPQSGAAYVFARSGTAWTQQAYLKASNTENNDFFGAQVAVFGDTVLVGAPLEDGNAGSDGSDNTEPDSGAAYVFGRTGTTWTFQNYLKASNADGDVSPNFGDRFGSSVAVSGGLVLVGAPFESSNAIGVNGDQNNDGAQYSGAAYVFGPPLPPAPEITVSQGATNIVNGGTGQGYLVADTNTQTRSFTIRNTGNDFLTGLTITFDGPDAAKFSVSFNPVAPLTPTSNTTFSVRFSPSSPGTNTATLHIASNDADENPFDIQLSGVSLSFTEDRDGDGLNDASELLMASLGFNFQVGQTNLVNTLFSNIGGAVSNLNGIGYFTQSQLQALNVNSPLLARDPLTGLFKLTIGVERAAQLTNFFPFPMTAPQTIINAEGKLEFRFTAPDAAAFFRLESR